MLKTLAGTGRPNTIHRGHAVTVLAEFRFWGTIRTSEQARAHAGKGTRITLKRFTSMTFITLTTRHFEVFNQHMDFCIDTAVPPILVTLRLTQHISGFVVPRPAEEIFSTSPEQNISLPVLRAPHPLR